MKNNRFKRGLIAAIAATALLISMIGTVVMAYTPDPDIKGSITVHKYSRTSAAIGENPTGGELDASETAGLGVPLAGAGFTLYWITMPTLTGTETYTGEYTVDLSAWKVTFDLVSGGTAEGTIDTPAEFDEQFTNNSGETTFSNLDHGYYVLAETTYPGIEGEYNKSEPSVISLPLTDKEGQDFNYDIHVYPKNISNQPITKTIDDATRAYKTGDIVSFTINAGISNTEPAPENQVLSAGDLHDGTNYGSMRIIDYLPDGLIYSDLIPETGYKIYFLTADNNKQELLPAEYSFDDSQDNLLIWDLTNPGIDEAIRIDAVAIVIELDLQIEVSATALENRAESIVTKAGGDNTVDPPITPPVQVPTGNIEVDKYDQADNDVKLSGAVFAIATNAEATQFLKPDGTSKLIAKHTDLKNDTEIILGTTDTAGWLIFSGLSFDPDDGAVYRLVEVHAPAGYQLKEAAIIADIEPEAELVNQTTKVGVANYANGIVDPDNPKFSLPLTGSTGTLLFTLIGIVIMATVTVIYIRSKRKQKI